MNGARGRRLTVQDRRRSCTAQQASGRSALRPILTAAIGKSHHCNLPPVGDTVEGMKDDLAEVAALMLFDQLIRLRDDLVSIALTFLGLRVQDRDTGRE